MAVNLVPLITVPHAALGPHAALMCHGSIAGKKEGTTSIEQISAVYGKQAVVVSIDPRRVYVTDPTSVSAGRYIDCKLTPHSRQLVVLMLPRRAHTTPLPIPRQRQASAVAITPLANTRTGRHFH